MPEPMSAEDFAIEVWVCVEKRSAKAAIPMIEARDALIRQAAREEGRREWISVKDRLPEKCDPVIVYGINDFKKGRTLRAAYARQFELVASDDAGYAEDWGEYSEEKDDYFVPEGWYEWNEEEETHWRVSFEIIHWMPLPEPPDHILDAGQMVSPCTTCRTDAGQMVGTTTYAPCPCVDCHHDAACGDEYTPCEEGSCTK